MSLPAILSNLRLPVIGAPLFLISDPALVIAQCKSGIVGSFPALNAREDPGDPPLLDRWLRQITEELDAHNQANPDRPAAPFAVNQIVHRSNTRLDRDVEICAKRRVPIWITSMGAQVHVNEAAHAVGAITLHDVTNDFYARKAVSKGADGLILLGAGAGGHTGYQNPFALVGDVRRWFDGPIGLAGAIATGDALLAAQAVGADFGYIGSPFIAASESCADAAYKDMIVNGTSQDIVTTDAFTGVRANYLRGSITAHGLDPDGTAKGELDTMDTGDGPKPWRDIWGAGEGIGAVTEIAPLETTIARLEREYIAARQRLTRISSQGA